MSISDIIPLLLFFSSYIYDGGSSTHWQAVFFFYYWGEKEGERKVEKRNTSPKFFKENY